MSTTSTTSSSSSSSASTAISTPETPIQPSILSPSLSVFHVNNIKNHISIILDFTNFLLWQTLFTNILHCYQLYDHIDPAMDPPPQTLVSNDTTSINPAYTLWLQIDHIIISWLHATISPEILKHVLNPGKFLSARDTWAEIEKLFHDHVNAKYMQLKLAFNQAVKGTRSMAEYLQFIKSTVDSLHSIGRPVDDVIL